MDNRIKKLRKSFWSFFIIKRPIAWLLTFAIIIFGIVSINSLPREVQPEINIPIASISTVLPGASPGDIESLITEPIEKQIANVNDIKNLTSTSSFGSSTIVVEFEASADLDKAVQDLKDAVDFVKPDLPEDATDPAVFRAEANEYPIITFSIIGDQPLYELTAIAEVIQDELESISGVSSVSLVGGQFKEINVLIDPQKIDNYGLNIQNVSNAIRSANNNLPIGVISTEDLNYSLRIDNRYQDLNDIRNLPILNIEGTPIYISDIATVEESYPIANNISKFSINGEESKRTVSLRINKKEGENLLRIIDEAKTKISDLKKTIAQDVDVAVSNDNSFFIRQDLGILTSSGIQTTILIIIILFLALGFKEGIITGLSIPITFLIAFTVLKLMDMSINSLSLFSLVIALGLMVDTAIVIMEGIYENMRKGYNSQEAAIISVDTYKWPLIAGTMTTIFAFFPMLLVSGILGEFLKTLPITISAALFASLFISLTLGPSISAKFLHLPEGKNKQSILEPIFEVVRKRFEFLIRAIINRKSLRILTIITALLLFSASMALPITGTLKAELFPKTDTNYFIVDIETPKGVVIEETEKATQAVEEILYKFPEIENFVAIIGSSQAQAATDIIELGGSSSSNLANITVNLLPKEERELKSYEVTAALLKEFEKINSAKIKIREISEGPPTESPITVRITGEDLDTLRKISSDMEQIIGDTPKTININTSLESGLNEFKFTLDRENLSFHGLSEAQVSGLIRNIVQGVEASTITIDQEELDVIVKYQLPRENGRIKLSVSDIENFQIQTPKGYSVTLNELGSYEFTESLAGIEREDQKRIIKVTSDVTKDGNTVEITAAIQAEIDNYELPTGYEISMGGDLEEINKSFQELFLSMGVGAALIMFTLVLMFNSFKQPFIILLTLPLALIGVFPGLLLVNLNLSFPAFLGVVALTGIVVNDAIVLIDRINQNRREGAELKESIAEAANARLQPIIMTTITTVVGILPLALTNEFWAGLGFSMVFGLTAATLLTLIVIPVLYYMFEARADKKRLRRKKEKTEQNLNQIRSKLNDNLSPYTSN